MAKKGGSKHVKRLATSKVVPLTNKKQHVWIIRTAPGPHSSKKSIPLVVILRDVLKFAKTSDEAKKIIYGRQVHIDGVVRTNPAFPVGFMDVLTFPKAGISYQLLYDKKGRLVPKELDKHRTDKKLLKVIDKHTIKGGKISLTLHDGRSIIADNKIHVGDSILISIPEVKIQSVLKLEEGVTCFITEGKHAGIVAKLKEIIQRKEGKQTEAKLENKEEGEFITVAKYLFVINHDFANSPDK